MFLNSLKPKEKDNFLKLAVAIIKADGIVEESEKRVLSAYANEMQVPVCSLDEQGDRGSRKDFNGANQKNLLFGIDGIGFC